MPSKTNTYSSKGEALEMRTTPQSSQKTDSAAGDKVNMMMIFIAVGYLANIIDSILQRTIENFAVCARMEVFRENGIRSIYLRI